jgi:hypothetical protein
MTHQVLSKFYRLKMTDDIRDLITNIPFRNLEETTVKEQIYRAYGEIQIGSKYQPVDIRIWLQDGAPKLEIKSKQAQVYAVYPFDTKNEQEEAKKGLNNMLLKWWN